MNRLWVRLSIGFTFTIILVTSIPLVFFFLFRLFGLMDFTPPEYIGVTIENVEAFQGFVEGFVFQQLIRSLITAAVAGIGTGILISRSIAQPLNTLEEGARAIGEQNLTYRVDLNKGSHEILAVARSFNQMADQLQQAEVQRQNLLADVAHELRTPLTVLQGNLRGILDDVFPLEKKEISRLFDQTRHLTHLVNDLHELAQAEAHRLPLNFVEVDVPKLLQQAAAGFRPLAEEKEIDMRVELLGKLPYINADLDRLQQSLNNLISNALRHTPAGGTITLQGESATPEHLTIRVIDNGQGILPEHLPSVFDRFYRPDASRQRYDDHGGTGLGLAIVRAIVESHEGTATVDSAGENQGTTFTLTFPVENS